MHWGQHDLVFLRQMRNVISAACFVSALGSPSNWAYPKSPGRCQGAIPAKCSTLLSWVFCIRGNNSSTLTPSWMSQLLTPSLSLSQPITHGHEWGLERRVIFVIKPTVEFKTWFHSMHSVLTLPAVNLEFLHMPTRDVFVWIQNDFCFWSSPAYWSVSLTSSIKILKWTHLVCSVHVLAQSSLSLMFCGAELDSTCFFRWRHTVHVLLLVITFYSTY